MLPAGERSRRPRLQGDRGGRQAQARPVAGIDTGFADLNRMTGGLHDQNLVVVAARPGLGKTSFCLNVACHAAIRNGKRVGIFSLEMSKPEIMKRMISSESEVDAHRIQSGYLSREDWMEIGRATAAISEAPIHLDDSANLPMLQVRAKAQRLALEHGLDLIACKLQHQAQIKANSEWVTRMRNEWNHHQIQENGDDSACPGLRALK
jgi:replicative DNA helicase